MLNVPIANIFETLQDNLGSAYVNDFNLFGRVYQVRAQADPEHRLDREAITRLKVRSATGALVPLGTLVDIRDVTGPVLVQRYNMYTSIPVQVGTPPGRLELDDDRDHGRWRATACRGHGIEWTELAFQEQQTGNTATYIFALSVLFVFLALARTVRELVLPLAIILIVPMSVLSALLGVMTARPRQQHPDADRPRRAGRPRRQERDPDRRVRAPERGPTATISARWSRPAGCACGRS
jgi:HAE1 family hydrophobic/amphiphilic exporter-1